MTVWEVPTINEVSPRSREALKNADAAIILFDMCNKVTLDHVPCWARKYLALDLIIFTDH